MCIRDRCSNGYPGKYKKGKIIKNINKVKDQKRTFIYHAGTKILGNSLLSIGGRVINITSLGKNFRKIRNEILKTLKTINWKNGFYRKDIGWRVIKK